MSKNKRMRLHECKVKTRAEFADEAIAGETLIGVRSLGARSPGTCYSDIVVRMRREWEAKGFKFEEPEEAAYWGYYMTEDKRIRVEVRLKYGERIRGYVTMTTGWMPAFMLLQRSNSRGSYITLGPDDEIVRTWWRQ